MGPIVDADASLTACSTTKRCSSDRLKRDSGTPRSLGSSHAIALTCATSCGGETTRATRPRSIIKPRDALGREPSSPASDAVGRHVDPPRDLAITVPVGGQQHELGANDDAIGQSQAARPPLKLTADLPVELDRCRHSPHATAFATPPAVPSTRRKFRRPALIWRGICQGGSSLAGDVVGAGGALAGRHGRKVRCGRLRGQTDIRGLDLKTRCSSRLAV
jgi:hypothetical protein